MPHSYKTDKKRHFQHSNAIKSTVSNHFRPHALALCRGQKFPPSREPEHGGTGTPLPPHPSRNITEPEPRQRHRDPPLQNITLLFDLAWLLGLNATREKSISDAQHNSRPTQSHSTSCLLQ